MIAGIMLVASLLLVAAWRLRHREATDFPSQATLPGPVTLDLPCPWCMAATSETDTRCPSCHQEFG